MCNHKFKLITSVSEFSCNKGGTAGSVKKITLISYHIIAWIYVPQCSAAAATGTFWWILALVFVSYCPAWWWWWSKIICINRQSDSRTIKWRLSGKTVNGWHFKNWNHPHNCCLQTWQTIILPGWRLSFKRGCHFTIPLFSLRDNAALKGAYAIFTHLWDDERNKILCYTVLLKPKWILATLCGGNMTAEGGKAVVFKLGGGSPGGTRCHDKMDTGLQQMVLILLLTTVKTLTRRDV